MSDDEPNWHRINAEAIARFRARHPNWPDDAELIDSTRAERVEAAARAFLEAWDHDRYAPTYEAVEELRAALGTETAA
jgi:hypothetical protein